MSLLEMQFVVLPRARSSWRKLELSTDHSLLCVHPVCVSGTVLCRRILNSVKDEFGEPDADLICACLEPAVESRVVEHPAALLHVCARVCHAVHNESARNVVRRVAARIDFCLSGISAVVGFPPYHTLQLASVVDWFWVRCSPPAIAPDDALNVVIMSFAQAMDVVSAQPAKYCAVIALDGARRDPTTAVPQRLLLVTHDSRWFMGALGKEELRGSAGHSAEVAVPRFILDVYKVPLSCSRFHTDSSRCTTPLDTTADPNTFAMQSLVNHEALLHRYSYAPPVRSLPVILRPEPRRIKRGRETECDP